MARCRFCGKRISNSTLETSLGVSTAAQSSEPSMAQDCMMGARAIPLNATLQAQIDGHLSELLEQASRSSGPDTRLTVRSVILTMARMISVAPYLADVGIDATALRRALRQHDPDGETSRPDEPLAPYLVRANDIATTRGARCTDIPALIDAFLTEQARSPELALFQRAARGALPGTRQRNAASATAAQLTAAVDVTSEPMAPDGLARLSRDRSRRASHSQAADRTTLAERHSTSRAARGAYRSRARLHRMRTPTDPRQLTFHGLQPEWSKPPQGASGSTDIAARQQSADCSAVADRLTGVETKLARRFATLERDLTDRLGTLERQFEMLTRALETSMPKVSEPRDQGIARADLDERDGVSETLSQAESHHNGRGLRQPRKWRQRRRSRRRLSGSYGVRSRSFRHWPRYRFDRYRLGHLTPRWSSRRGQWRRSSPEPQEKRFYLAMPDDIVDAPSIGPRTAERLRPVGIRTVRDLMEADPVALANAVGARHITADTIRAWQTQSKLVMTIPWLRGTHAQLLVGAGYHDAADIAARPSSEVLAAILRFAGTREGQRVLRDGPPPPHEKIVAWATNAREAEPHRAA